MLSLTAATLLTGLFLLLTGGVLFLAFPKVRQFALASLRSSAVAAFTFGLAAFWFLWIVGHIGPADEIVPKKLLLVLFAVIAVGSWFFVKDFLAVRGLAALILLASMELLEAAFLQPPQSRLFLVSFVYLAIVLALYLGASPFRLRDFFEWVFGQEMRHRLVGGVLAAYGLLLCGVALTY